MKKTTRSVKAKIRQKLLDEDVTGQELETVGAIVLKNLVQAGDPSHLPCPGREAASNAHVDDEDDTYIKPVEDEKKEFEILVSETDVHEGKEILMTEVVGC